MKKKKIKFNSLFTAVSDFDLLKKEFENLEHLVFRSGETFVASSVEYRTNVWRNKVDHLSRWSKLVHYNTLKDLSLREISLRSQLLKIEQIEEEIKV